jgi:hypothetical protein
MKANVIDPNLIDVTLAFTPSLTVTGKIQKFAMRERMIQELNFQAPLERA